MALQVISTGDGLDDARWALFQQPLFESFMEEGVLNDDDEVTVSRTLVNNASTVSRPRSRGKIATPERKGKEPEGSLDIFSPEGSSRVYGGTMSFTWEVGTSKQGGISRREITRLEL
eukprot:3350032-Pyramimonas_sp.AAC.1